MKLRMIFEDKKSDAAVDYLSRMVKKSPFNGKVYVAGGWIRDQLLGKDSKDIDLVVAMPKGGIKFAEWITKEIGAYKKGSNPVIYPTYGTAKFNMTGVIHQGQDLSSLDIEAVMTRKEQYNDDKSRKPDVEPGTLAQDVERRDFTVNSLLKDLTTGEIVDLTGMGKADLKKGVVKTALNPDIIFREDPLRMLRAIRFTTKYDWDLPLFMIKGIKKNAARIGIISKERVRDELDKMLVTNKPKLAIELMRVTGLLKYVLPELNDLRGVTQNRYHNKTAYGHTLDVLEKVPPTVVKRLGALLHDIGKKATREVIDDEVHFFTHEKVGADIAADVLRRLKYPNEIVNRVKVAVAQHMRTKSSGVHSEKMTDKAIRKFQRQLGDHLEDVLDVIDADNKSHHPDYQLDKQIDGLRDRLKLMDVVPKEKQKLPLDGNDLRKIFNLKPGPQFKKLLDLVQDAVDGNPDLSKDQAIEIVKQYLETQ